MKRRLFALFLACLLLTACAPAPVWTDIQVYVIAGEGVTALDKSLWISPGADAVFRLSLRQGYTLSDVSYEGDYDLTQENGIYLLTLRAVSYPTGITVTAEKLPAAEPRSIVYHPNGGEGDPVTVPVPSRRRPNTRTDLFARQGFTLTGWNTAPDGSGISVGLGSRVTVPDGGLTLYAQWAKWTAAEDFTYAQTETGITLTGYRGDAARLVLPAQIGGQPVTAIGGNAFQNCTAREVIFPNTLQTVTDGAFSGAELEELTLFDNLKAISDAAFAGAKNLQTLHMNAIEDPYGYQYRRESLYADKVDLLIQAQGRKKLICYGGCSMWYNLIGEEAVHRFGETYAVINLGLNGTVNSLVQMEILEAFLEPGDIVFHAPELSSPYQLLTNTDMGDGDELLWCGMEYNYDLFSLVDLRNLTGVFDSLNHYWSIKKPGGSYDSTYTDSSGRLYLDYTGSLPLLRTHGRTDLADSVTLDPTLLSDGLPLLTDIYRNYLAKGAKVYLSYGCVDVDALPEAERGNVEIMDAQFREITESAGATVISRLEDYLYHTEDFYDTHYHLLTQAAYRNTESWLNDLETQMVLDGLWTTEGAAP